MSTEEKARKPLTREGIVDAAIEMLDAEGAGKLSMRRLGDALGVEGMALYHYFANKDAILDAVVERLVAETQVRVPEASADWKATMRAGVDAVNQALRAHPRAASLFIGRRYRTETSLAWLEGPLAILHAAGFRDRDLVDAAHAVLAYVAGWFTLAAGEGGTWSGPEEAELAMAPEAAPLAAAHAAQLRDWGSGFDEGLQALLDGLERRRG